MNSKEDAEKKSANINMRLKAGTKELMQTIMEREFRTLSDIVRVSLYEHIKNHHPDLEEEARRLLGPGS